MDIPIRMSEKCLEQRYRGGYEVYRSDGTAEYVAYAVREGDFCLAVRAEYLHCLMSLRAARY
jgi:hypothetical protein